MAFIRAGRLHPLTLVILAFNAVRNFLIPGLIVLFTGQEASLGVLLLGFLGFNLLFGVVRYVTFSYRVEQGELITREGLLERRERHIPLGRVQDLRLEQGLLHRVLGVVDVNVETAGGSGAEATLSVLSRAEAEALRQAVLGSAAAGLANAAAVASGAESAETLLKLTWRDLVLEGLTANRGASVLVILLASWQFLDDLVPASLRMKLAGLLSENMERWFLPGGTANWAGLAALALVVVVASVLFSVAGALLIFHGFRLELRNQSLSRSYGLLTRRVSSLPRRRIQVLEIEENWLRRWCGLVTVRVDTAGGGDAREDAERRAGRDVIVPIMRRGLLGPLIPVLLPVLEVLPEAWTRVDRCAVRRAIKVGGAVCVVLAGVGYFFSRQLWTLWPLGLLPMIVVISLQAWRHGGYQRLEGCFCTRRGWLNRSTRFVPVANIQVLVVRQTPFDRGYAVRSLLVDTAGQTYTGGGPHLRNLPQDVALTLARDLARAASMIRYPASLRARCETRSKRRGAEFIRLARLDRRF
jgi:putative membrane protein